MARSEVKRTKVNLTYSQKQRLKALSKKVGLNGKMSPTLRYCLSEWDRRLFCGARLERVEQGKKIHQVQVDLDPATHQRLSSIADWLGISLSALFRIAFLRMEETKGDRPRSDSRRNENTSGRPRSDKPEC